MPATIKIKNSSTTGAVPTSSDLVQGELAVNVTDLGLYTENASGTVVKLNAPSIDDKNTGATKHLTISTGGNLGLGVTPNAWSSDRKALQIGSRGCLFSSTGSGSTHLSNNSLFESAVMKYVQTGPATIYEQGFGQHAWSIAASGTAGNAITFTQAMTLDASGNLLVGTTSQIGGSRINFAQPNTSTDMKIGVSVATGTNAAYQVFVNNTVTTIGTENSSGGSLVSGSGAYSTVIANSGAYPLSFGTNNTERARIDSSGNLLVGTASQIASGFMCLSFANNVRNGIVINDTDTGSGTSAPMIFRRNGSQVGSITTTTTTTAYVTSSDYRLKENIAPMADALSVVAQLKPCTYTWKSDGSSGQGFIAHELQTVVPDAVVGEKDAVDEDGNPKYQGIDTSFLVATLTAAIQELKAEFDAYKASHP